LLLKIYLIQFNTQTADS